jgi:hypothetical protein
MKKRRGVIPLVIAMALVAACGGSAPGIEADRSDEDGLIRFGMPQGWTNTRISSGRHYTREGMPEDPTVLQVAPREHHPAVTFAQVQEGTRGKHEVQGHSIIRESTKDKNGFTAWEAVYEANVRGDDVVFHDVFLYTDGLLVEISLNARKNDYDSYVGDLLAVVESVRANDTGS